MAIGKTRNAMRACAAACGVLLFLTALLPPVQAKDALGALGAPPVIPGEEAFQVLLVADNLTGAVLYQKGAEAPQPLLGGAVRWMAALTALDYLSPDDMVTIGETPVLPLGARLIGLRRNRSLTVRDLSAAMLIYCAQDAAVVLAEAALQEAGSDDFVALMNQKAAALGMTHTVYKEATGSGDTEQVTTATDQLLLARAMLENDALSALLALPEYTPESPDSGLTQPMTPFSGIMDPADPAYDSRVTAAARGSGAGGSSMVLRARQDGVDLILIFWQAQRPVTELYAAAGAVFDAYAGCSYVDLAPPLGELAGNLTYEAQGVSAAGCTLEEDVPLNCVAYPGFNLDPALLSLTPVDATPEMQDGRALFPATVAYGGDILGTVALAAQAGAQDKPGAGQATPGQEALTLYQPSVKGREKGFFEIFGWLVYTLGAGLAALAVIALGKRLREKLK